MLHSVHLPFFTRLSLKRDSISVQILQRAIFAATPYAPERPIGSFGIIDARVALKIPFVVNNHIVAAKLVSGKLFRPARAGSVVNQII